MIKIKIDILEGNGHVYKGIITMKRGFRTVKKSVYRLIGENHWRYLDTSKPVRGSERFC